MDHNFSIDLGRLQTHDFKEIACEARRSWTHVIMERKEILQRFTSSNSLLIERAPHFK